MRDFRINNIYYINLTQNSKADVVKTVLNLRKNKYDYALFSPISNDRGVNILAKLINAKISIGEQFKRSNKRFVQVRKENSHIVTRNGNMLIDSMLAKKVALPSLKGFSLLEEKPSIKQIGLCIGTSKPSKTWALENYIHIAEYFEKGGYKILFLGGKSERDIFPIELFTEHENWGDYLGKTTLLESTTLLSQCSLVLGGDTGIMHMAAAVMIPTLSIFSCSDPALHAPYSNLSYVVTAGIDCQYCYENGGYKRCPEYRCLTTILPDMIIPIMEGILNSNPTVEKYKFIVDEEKE